MTIDDEVPEDYEARLAAVRAEKLAGIGVEPLPKKPARRPNSVLGIQPIANGSGNSEHKPPAPAVKSGRRMLAPLIDRALVEAGKPLQVHDVHRAVNAICTASGLQPASFVAIANALPKYAEAHGWTRSKDRQPAWWSKGSAGTPAVEAPTSLTSSKPLDESPAIGHERQAPELLKPTANWRGEPDPDRLTISELLQSTLDELRDVGEGLAELRANGIAVLDSAILALVREGMARHEAQAVADDYFLDP